jgi:thymidylate synthase
MGPYEEVLDMLVNFGTRKQNRTGVDTLGLFGLTLTYDLDFGFPAITTKRLAFEAVKAELIGFLRGYDNAADFRELGTTIWDANANENAAWVNHPLRAGTDDLGSIYGVQWRTWKDIKIVGDAIFDAGTMEKLGYDHVVSDTAGHVYAREIDQIQNVIDTLRKNPFDRRLIVTAWNPGDADQCALPPCHMIMQFGFDPASERLHLIMFQRSADWFLGVPFNIASYALLLSMIAQVTNLKPGRLTILFGDAHLYVNHEEQAREQVGRTPYDFPKLVLNPECREIDSFGMEDIRLDGYKSHPAIKAPMAV